MEELTGLPPDFWEPGGAFNLFVVVPTATGSAAAVDAENIVGTLTAQFRIYKQSSRPSEEESSSCMHIYNNQINKYRILAKC